MMIDIAVIGGRWWNCAGDLVARTLYDRLMEMKSEEGGMNVFDNTKEKWSRPLIREMIAFWRRKGRRQ